MALDNSPETRADPPPNYYNSDQSEAEEYIAPINALQLSQLLQKLIDVLSNILDASFEKKQFIKGLKTALRQQPAVKHIQIFNITQTILNTCYEVYKFEKTPFISWKINHNGKDNLVKETVLDNKDAIAAEVHIQHHPNTSIKNQPRLQESIHDLKLSQIPSGKKMHTSKPISSNAKSLPILVGKNTERVSTSFATSSITCDTTSCESSPSISRHSSPEITSTPSRIEGALQEQTPKKPKASDYALRSLIDQSTEEFIHHTREQIRQFALYKIPSATYDVIFSSLDNEESESGSKWSECSEWSTGSKWLDLAEAGQTDGREGRSIMH